LEDDSFPFGAKGLFSGALALSFRECKETNESGDFLLKFLKGRER